MNSVEGNKDAHGNPLVYAGDLKMNRKEIRGSITRQWHFTATLRTPKVNYKVRAVIL